MSLIGIWQDFENPRNLAIPNLHTIQTLTSAKAAITLDKALTEDRAPLNILIQINTSQEDSKSGVDPVTETNVDESELLQIAKSIITNCPRLHLHGLMTIGSLSESVSGADENADFNTLKISRDILQTRLGQFGKNYGGPDGQLLLSMGMSGDFEPAIRAGANIVRVGTGIFGTRASTA